MFAYYDIDPETWLICQTVDKAKVNIKIGRLLNIPSIGCMNHLLQSEVNFYESRETKLRTNLVSVQRTMREVKANLRNRATLRNLTPIRPR